MDESSFHHQEQGRGKRFLGEYWARRQVRVREWVRQMRKMMTMKVGDLRICFGWTKLWFSWRVTDIERGTDLGCYYQWCTGKSEDLIVSAQFNWEKGANSIGR